MLGKWAPKGVRTYRSEWTGGYETLKNGRVVKKMKGKEYIPTQQGEIEISEWIQKASEEVKELGMEELLERIKEHWSRYRWLSNEEDLMEWSLKSMYHKSYMAWEDFTIIWG